MAESTWEILTSIDTKDIAQEKQGKFTYLSWADAWATVKSACPDASFKKHNFEYDNPTSGKRTLPYMIDHQGYAYVMVTVTIAGEAITETYMVLGIVGKKPNSPISQPNSFQINTALQRCLVKCLAYHGFGIHVYRGEEFGADDEDKKLSDGPQGTKVQKLHEDKKEQRKAAF